MESTLTSEGVLVGDTEYGVYTAIARLVVVAFISDTAFHFLFAQRVGIYLVTELSVRGGIRAWFRSLYHRPNPAHSRLLACALFALTFLVTRGLDVFVTAYFSARKLGSTKRVTYVSAADLSKRPVLASAYAGIGYNRTIIYSLLRSSTKDLPHLKHGNLWPETIGMLTDAEIAAMTLAPYPCIAENKTFLTLSLFSALAARKGGNLSSVPSSITYFQAPSYNFFGQDVHIIDVDSVSFPIPFSYMASGHGRSPMSRQSRRQFGILTSPTHSLTAYDMECGLTTGEVSDWLTKHPPGFQLQGKERVPTLWYNDYHLTVPSRTPAVPHFKLAFMLVQEGKEETDVLLFSGQIIGSLRPGSSIRTTQLQAEARSTRHRIAQVITPRGDGTMSRGNEFQFGDFLPLSQSPKMECQPAHAPHFDMLWRNDGSLINALDATNTSHPNLVNGPVKQPEQCLVRFAPAQPLEGRSKVNMSDDATFFSDPGNRGSEVCRARLRFYHGERSMRGSSIPNDMITAFRYQEASSLDLASVSGGTDRIRCMARGDDGTAQHPRPVMAFLGNTTARLGYVTDPALVVFNTTTDSDPASPQAVFIHLIVISWIELGLIAVMAILLSAMGVWGDVAEMVALVMYAFSHQPTPPHVAHRPASDANDQSYASMQQRSLLADGLGGVQLMEPIQLAAVQLDAVVDSQTADSNPVIDLRLVPASWGVTKGENVSLLADRPCFSGADDLESHSETVVAASGVFEQVMQTVRRLQSRKAQGDNLV